MIRQIFERTNSLALLDNNKSHHAYIVQFIYFFHFHQVLTYKKLIDIFKPLFLWDLDYKTNNNKNVSYVRLAIARAELYRQGNRECFSGRAKPFDSLATIDDLPPGPLSLIKIDHNDLLYRYLNNEVRGLNFEILMDVLHRKKMADFS
jgi:hypothetical protein